MNWPQTAPWNCCFLPGDYLFPGAVDFLLSLSCFHAAGCLFRVQDKNIRVAGVPGGRMKRAALLYLLVCRSSLRDRPFLHKRQQVCLMVKSLKRRRKRKQKTGRRKDRREKKRKK